MSRKTGNLGNGQYPNSRFTRVYFSKAADLNSLSQWLYNISGATFQDMSKSVLSIRMWPFDWFDELQPSMIRSTYMCVGREVSQIETYTLSNTTAPTMRFIVGTFRMEESTPTGTDAWRYHNAKYAVYCPMYGFIELDPRKIMWTDLTVEYAIDLHNGTADIYIVRQTDNTVIETRSCQIAVDLPIAANLNGEKVAASINAGLGTVGSLIGVGAGIATGNVLGAITAAGSTLSNAIGFQQAVSGPDVGGGLCGSGLGSYMGPMSCYMIRIMPRAAEPSGYAAQYGRPCCKQLTLSSLTGYTEVDSVHMEGFSTATQGEIDEIESLLKTGVIL